MEYKWKFLSLGAILALSGCGGTTTNTGIQEMRAGISKTIKSEQCNTKSSEKACYSAPKIEDKCQGRGGEIFYFGYDDNFNGILDNSEIDASKDVIVCNGYRGIQGEKGEKGDTGTPGLTGDTGSQGYTSLINSTKVSAGEVCKNGGIVFDIGIDKNSNNILEEIEVTQTQTMCIPDIRVFAKIHDIQGSGATSPKENEKVTVEAIVIGDYQEDGELKGFFIQEEDADADSDDQTSEGIFVYDNAHAVDVGDKVEVTGTVKEFHALTELGDISSVVIKSAGETLPSEAPVTLPMASESAFEKYEGMRVKFNQELYATDVYNLSKYGEVLLSSTDRLYKGTQVADPHNGAAEAIADANKLNQIILDDKSTEKYIKGDIIYPASKLSKTNELRVGDKTANLSGIMSYGYNKYRVQPTAPVTFTKDNARPADAPTVGGNLKVASINVLNYFRTIDDGSNTCGTHNQGCRGADSQEELARQTEKMKEALSKMDSAVIGLMEIENDGGTTAVYIANLLPNFDYIRNPGGGELGTDVITVGLIYDTTKVEAVGDSKTIADGAYQGAFDDRNRKPLAQKFKDLATGEEFIVVNNHFKSKGSGCGAGDDDASNLQGNCNGTRTKASEDMISWTNDLKNDMGDDDILIIGDLNAYAKEDPIKTLEDGGFENLDRESKPYSYVYYGEAGTLDYALANGSLKSKVADVKRWHINADESWVFDYNDDATDQNYGRPKPDNYLTAIYTSDEYRMSDHDPIIVGIDFNTTENNQTNSGGSGTGSSNDLFFSEYIEGSSNNKALEIYNPSEIPVDLSEYTIEIYANGKTTPNTPAITLSGSIVPGGLFVIAHPSASDEISADMTGSLYYNGDDAAVLKHNDKIIDVIGQIGTDPGSAWGSGNTSTKDRTLRRKANITEGDTDGTDAFDPVTEWDGFAKDSFDGLGSR